MRITVACLLITWSIQLSGSRAATILHGSAISHQSFTRLSTASEPLILQQPNPQQLVRIVVPQRVQEQPLKRFLFEMHEEEEQHQVPNQTPAHLTYAARPVVHQMLPRIKPVRNISFASLLPGPRSLATNHNLSPV